MAEYIYYCTSLPALSFGMQVPMSSEKFLDSASAVLNAGDYGKLCDLDFSQAARRVVSSGFFCTYYQWEIALRNIVMQHRVKHSRGSHTGEGTKSKAGASGSAGLQQAVESALEQNPLEAERRLDLLRWRKLDELCGHRLFDMTFLGCYLLKLRLLERAALWQVDAGSLGYQALSKEIVEEEKVGDL